MTRPEACLSTSYKTEYKNLLEGGLVMNLFTLASKKQRTFIFLIVHLNI